MTKKPKKYRSFETINLLIEYLIFKKLEFTNNRLEALQNYRNELSKFGEYITKLQGLPTNIIYKKYLDRKKNKENIDDLFFEETETKIWDGYVLPKEENEDNQLIGVIQFIEDPDKRFPYKTIYLYCFNAIFNAELRKKIDQLIETIEEEDFKTPLLNKYGYFQHFVQVTSNTYLKFRTSICDEFLDFIKPYFDESNEKALELLILNGVNPKRYLLFKDSAARLIDTFDKLSENLFIEKKINHSLVKLPSSELETWIFDHCKYWSKKEKSYILFSSSTLVDYISRNKISCKKQLIDIKGNRVIYSPKKLPPKLKGGISTFY